MKLKLAVVLIALAALSGQALADETDWQGLNPNLGSGELPVGVVAVSPSASVAAGTYHASQSVVLSAASSNSIRYTVDGSDPACPSTGTLYSSALTVNSTETLKAIACYNSDNSVSSSVSSYAYVFTCSTSSVSHGSVGSYPGCGISCNSGYRLSGSSCVSSGGGGGGGGSSSSSSSTTTTTTTTTTTATATIPGLSLPYANPTTEAEIQSNRTVLISYIISLLQKISGTSGTTTAATATGSLTQTLTYGTTSDQVKILQQFLKDQGAEIYPEQLVTGYFGNATKLAVGRFQIKYGIVSSASDDGYGIVGPKTRAKINSLMGE